MIVFFYEDDKTTIQTNTLFNDEHYKDRDYHEEYPTIYHLRNELMSNSEHHDVRLVYLACHHIMKHRGNFLTKGDKINIDSKFTEALDNLNRSILEYGEDAEGDVFLQKIRDEIHEEIHDILLNQQKRKSDKAKEISQLITKPSKADKELWKLIVGNKGKLGTIFNDTELNDLTVDFKNDYQLEKENFEDRLKDRIDLINNAYEIYSALELERILGNISKRNSDPLTLSKARIKIFEKHKQDLKDLKKLLKSIDIIDKKICIYNKVFRKNEKQLANYVAYSGHIDSRNQDSPLYRCGIDEFHNFLIKELKSFEIPEAKRIVAECELGDFLPKISSSTNSVIPYQLHKLELEKILENASHYIDFLSEKVRAEIVQIFTFRIPYYVGPFDNRSKFAWLKRNNNEKIYPWNIEKIVDLTDTAEKFVNRMTNKCSWLIGEDVLPKESLLYSEFMLRNAINTLNINGVRLEKKYRDAIYTDLFLNRKKTGKITKKRIISTLKNHGLDCCVEQLSGMDNEIPVTLKARIDFNTKIKTDLLDSEIEEIIVKLTALPDNLEMIKGWLTDKFKNKIATEDIEAISKFQYKDWGGLSRKLLSEIKEKFPDGRELSIIEIMKEQPLNLSELLSHRYSFIKQIEECNNGIDQDVYSITKDNLEERRLSPPVKKTVWVTLRIYKELIRIMGKAPKKIFIEVTREEGKKTETKSRKKKLLELYNNCEKDVRDWNTEINNFEEHKFKAKKLYLYYLQKGRCLYTGEEITLENLADNSLYNIDHILPRSLTKDDSLDNLVLVKQSANKIKDDKYPIDREIQKKNEDLWNMLFHSGSMTKEKLSRLTRITSLSEDELLGFVNRQLVETGQTNKNVAEILKRVSPKTKVVYVKSRLVADFRYNDGQRKKGEQHFIFPKNRAINDYHHAKDAYLNIVVGNSYDTRFSSYINRKTNKSTYRQYNLIKIFDSTIEDNYNVAWIPGEDGTIKTVKKMMNRNNIMVSYESYRNTGEFYDQKLMKKGKGQQPIKTADSRYASIDRYGAYNKVYGSHLCLVEHEIKNEIRKTLITIPIFLAVQELDQGNIIEYLKDKLGFINPKVLKSEIKYGSILEVDGTRYRIMARTNNMFKCANVYQLILKNEYSNLIKILERTLIKERKLSEEEENKVVLLYKELVGRLLAKPYSFYSPLKKQGENLYDLVPEFGIKKPEEKIKIIFSILKLFNTNGQSSDLSEMYSFEGKKKGQQVGVITIPADITNKKVNLINNSITGFYENITELV